MTQAGWAGALALQPLLEALKWEKTISWPFRSLGTSALPRHLPQQTRRLHPERVTLLGRLRSLGPLRRRKEECFLFVYIPSSYKMFFKPRADDYTTKQVILLRGCFSLKVRVKVAVVSNSLWPHGLYNPWNSPGHTTGVGSLSHLQGIFPIQGSNPGLLNCRRILYQLSHQGSPGILEWVAYPFSRGSSRPRNQTTVSCIAGGFFTNWAIREALCFSLNSALMIM